MESNNQSKKKEFVTPEVQVIVLAPSTRLLIATNEGEMGNGGFIDE